MPQFFRGPSCNRWAFCGFVGLGLLILGPLLKPGFILTLDMVFTPVIRMPEHINNSYPLYALLHFINLAMPADIIQKLLLLTIFTLAGYGVFRLVRYLTAEEGWAGATAAGLFYTVNPFTYARLMAGQYELLLGYALLPFFITRLLLFIKHPLMRHGLILGLSLAVIGVVSLHILVIALILAACILVPLYVIPGISKHNFLSGLRIRKYHELHDDQVHINTVRTLWVAAGTFALLSSFWLLPLLLGKGSTAGQLSQFSATDSTAFQTLGGLPNVLRLQGFWLEASGQYHLPQTGIPAWGLLMLIIWVQAGYGLYVLWKSQRRQLAAALLTSMVIGTALALGLGGNWLAHLGFREPQKFASLLAFGFALGLGVSVRPLLNLIRTLFNAAAAKTALAVVLIIPVILTSTIFWGARGQLHASTYPEGWHEANDLLRNDHANFKAVLLPWHLYMKYEFSGRIIASPAPAFFDKPVIVSDNVERDGAGTSRSDPTKQELGKLLANIKSDNNLTSRLNGLDIKYLLLVRENNYRDYDYLRQQPHLTRVFTSDSVDIYLNQDWKEK